jgi:hypothetical protein
MRWNWNKVLWIVFALCLVIIVSDNYYWVKDGSWVAAPIGSAVAIFKWVAIAILSYVLIRPSSLAPTPTIVSEVKGND